MKKVYANLEDAYGRATAVYGPVETWFANDGDDSGAWETRFTDRLTEVMKVSKKIKNLFEDKLNIDGLTLVQNNGDVQEVKHYHLHLKPYYNEKHELLNIEDIYKKITK